MAQAQASFDARAFGVLHDLQHDYYGRRLATASSDTKVRIWDGETHQIVAELSGHEAPVLCVSWAAGRYANVLASASSGGRVVVWREAAKDQWQIVHQSEAGRPVNNVAFAPADYGLLLGASIACGDVLMFTTREVKASPVLPATEHWVSKPISAPRTHEGGVVAFAWAPSTSPATLASGPAAPRGSSCAPRRIATCGKDTVAIWRHEEKSDVWFPDTEFRGQHTGSYRDVQWRPNVGIPSSTLAACAEDGTVTVWVQDIVGQPWDCRAQWRVDGDARRLFWSKVGVTLAVSVGDRDTVVYGEDCNGQWEKLTDLGN